MFLVIFIGTIPGPVLTGSVLDTSCDVWQDSCGVRGSCWVYDRKDMSWKLFAWWCAVKVVSSLAFFIGGKVYKAPASSEKTIVINGKTKSELNGTPNGDYDVNFGKAAYDNPVFPTSEAPSTPYNDQIVLSTHI